MVENCRVFLLFDIYEENFILNLVLDRKFDNVTEGTGVQQVAVLPLKKTPNKGIFPTVSTLRHCL
jgi:hypothetical protein